MLLDYLAHDSGVQAMFLLALAACYVITMFIRHMRRENDAARQEKRYADARAVMVSTGKKVAVTQNDCD